MWFIALQKDDIIFWKCFKAWKSKKVNLRLILFVNNIYFGNLLSDHRFSSNIWSLIYDQNHKQLSIFVKEYTATQMCGYSQYKAHIPMLIWLHLKSSYRQIINCGAILQRGFNYRTEDSQHHNEHCYMMLWGNKLAPRYCGKNK